MAEYAYLQARRSRDVADGELLSVKRRLALGWFLAFDASDVRSPCVVAERAIALQRLHDRRKAMSDVTGPKLRAVLDGFIGFVEAQSTKWLAIDASELEGYGRLEEWLAETFATAEALGTGRSNVALDDECGLVWRARGRIYEIDGDGSDATYPFMGSWMNEPLAWLRPPNPADRKNADAIARAMTGYTKTRGPLFDEEGMTMCYAHPEHPGLDFVVSTGEDALAFELAIFHRKNAGIAFAPIAGEARLGAWAAHAARHLRALALPAARDFGNTTRWWELPGAADFGRHMESFSDDLAALRASVPSRLAHAIVDFVGRPSEAAREATFDLGALGRLKLAREADGEWETHVRAMMERAPGDTSWRVARPELLVAPHVQQAEIDAWLETFASDVAKGGAPLPWDPSTRAGEGTLTVHAAHCDPERFVSGFIPARRRSFEETPAQLVFVGAELVIVVADGARVAFRFPVPADFDRHAPLFVSGWWTARSGDRFATVLRSGTRSWRFDNDGKRVG